MKLHNGTSRLRKSPFNELNIKNTKEFNIALFYEDFNVIDEGLATFNMDSNIESHTENIGEE